MRFYGNVQFNINKNGLVLFYLVLKITCFLVTGVWIKQGGKLVHNCNKIPQTLISVF